MGYLGIDQSLSATGLCLLASDGTFMTAMTVDTDKARDATRLLLIKRALTTILPEVVFATLEGYAYGAVGHVFELGEVGGVTKVTLLEAGIEFRTVAPVQLKKFATGYGSASKDDMLDAARKSGHDFGFDDNQADAFFLARIAYMYSIPAGGTRCEREVLHALKNPVKKKAPQRVRRLVKNAV